MFFYHGFILNQKPRVVNGFLVTIGGYSLAVIHRRDRRERREEEEFFFKISAYSAFSAVKSMQLNYKDRERIEDRDKDRIGDRHGKRQRPMTNDQWQQLERFLPAGGKSGGGFRMNLTAVCSRFLLYIIV